MERMTQLSIQIQRAFGVGRYEADLVLKKCVNHFIRMCNENIKDEARANASARLILEIEAILDASDKTQVEGVIKNIIASLLEIIQKELTNQIAQQVKETG